MRRSGVLLHISSLPSPHGIGTLGAAAYEFATALAMAGQRFWQMLPVGPTGYRDSPYQSPSTFAGNPLFIDLEFLVVEGLLQNSEIEPLGRLPAPWVDFGALIPAKTRLLLLAARRFLRRGADAGYDAFRSSLWLDDYALFAALKQQHHGRPWMEWEDPLVLRHPSALSRARQKLGGRIELERAVQYFFHRQWESLHEFCLSRGVELIGDLPIFVAHDSADVWSDPDLFHLDRHGSPAVVAGVPPDYFSVTGQRWGNPLYRWEAHAADNYIWWSNRLGASFARFDMVRIDHFRGFAAYWEIPAEEETAINGHWVPGPGAELLGSLSLGQLPIIAEDLGVITEDVTDLRRQFGFPGMRVAQFGFDEELDTAIHHPDNYAVDIFAYTGTHDNDTTVGWFWGDNHRHDRRRLNHHRRKLLATVGTRGEEINWDMIRLVHRSQAMASIVPVPDLLGIGREGRMNTPGQEEGNWSWRLTSPLPAEPIERLGEITSTTGRRD
ncbi:MAG TPA: 4-alpha-glucanotransferase [Acidimicrobiia bacterium]|nr:4-alpha-glucanotransferase [Acidimicrobiia bacterium]